MQPLSQILNTQFNVSEQDVDEALQIKGKTGGDVGEILCRKMVITEHQLLAARGIQYQLPVWDKIPLENIQRDFTQKVPIQFLKRFHMLPLEIQAAPVGSSEEPPEIQAEDFHAVAKKDAIAVHDPADFQPLDDLAGLLGMASFDVVLSTREEIIAAINFAYDMSRDSAEQLVQDMEADDGMIIGEMEGTADLLDDTSDAPIIKLVNHILSQSIKARASDIHIEPYQESFKVRYRVDGILYDLLTPPKWIQASLISRIKVMAKMNIAEKRLPQDGRLEVKIGNMQIDVRVSTIPTSFGERVVLRLLNKTSSLLTLSDLGLNKDRLTTLEKLVSSPNGIILITGPTGSGKTTTLYAILSSLNSPDINIITIEDPIEYQINGISQIQVNPKIDLTFALGLRSIVRQDPDVILVGEIRDHETAEIAVQSALTGHLVFSTLHTNDSAGAITRLVDIGIEPFLISSSVIAVAAQRLVRVLCEKCKEPYNPDEVTLHNIGIDPGDISGPAVFRAKGCEHCFNTGYRGRIGIFEILEMENKLKSLILKSFDANRIQEEAMRMNMVSLRRDGIQKVLAGTTTIEEVLRVTQK
ncbi:MAG: type II secretion system protein GspE [Deltaproteobacteria bacterium]|nr:MAG: type II secretion system protein GspE [Deltaproteobacteria bacterium]